MNKVSVGSISHGTMRSEDLIPTFLDTLEELAGKEAADKFKLAWFDNLLSYSCSSILTDDSTLNDITENLFDELQDLAPYGLYFGAHPGDGSDYGFWPSEDLVEEMRHDNPDSVTDGSSQEHEDKLIRERYTGYVLQCNERGNLTMLEYVNGQNQGEVWSCV